MSAKLRNYRNEKFEVIRKIEFYKQHRNKLVNFVRDLNYKYEASKISKEDYLETLDEVLKGRTAEYWFEFYNNKISNNSELLKKQEERIRKEKSKAAIKPLFLTALLLVALTGLFYIQPDFFQELLQPEITGLVILDNTSISFDRILDCPRCGQHKAPPITDVSMTITATFTGTTENDILIDYFEKEWTMVDANGGIVESFDETYDKISWNVNDDIGSVSRSYTIKGPERTTPPTDYYFQSELANVKSDLWFVKVADPTTYNYTAYNMSVSGGTAHFIFSQSDDLTAPPTNFNDARGGTENTCYTQASESDTNRCTQAAASGNNHEPWIRFNFTVVNSSKIENITIRLEAQVTQSGGNEDANFIHLNYTNAAWSSFGDVTVAEVTRTVTYATEADIANLIQFEPSGTSTEGQVVILAEGRELDNGESVDVNFVQVEIVTSVITNDPPNDPSDLVINSTDTAHTNYTYEDLMVTFTADDPDTNDVLDFSIEWFTNNISNFSLPSIPIQDPGAANHTLDAANTTKHDNWSAQVRVCDDDSACSNYINTTQLQILNSIPDNQTEHAFNDSSFNEEETINVSIIYLDNDLNDYFFNITFEWFVNQSLAKRITYNNLANGTNISDTLASSNYSVNDNVTVQTFAFDRDDNSTLTNSSTLEITSTNVAPNDPTPLINSTFSSNLSNEELNVYFTPTDNDAGETLTYDIEVFQNLTSLFSLTNIDTTQDVLEQFIIERANTSVGNNYSAQVRVCDDSSACSDYINTSQLIILNSGPQINNVSIVSSWSITVNGNASAFFSFLVTDNDNYSDLDSTTARANFSFNYEPPARYNDTNVNPNDGGCVRSGNFGLNIANYTCTINIVFYDRPGDWNVSVFIQDNAGNSTQNNTVTFNLAETTSFSIQDAAANFPDAVPNEENITQTDVIAMNNTGNDNISTGQINVTAVQIHGDSDGSTFIPAENFTISTLSGVSSCDISAFGTYRLVNKSDLLATSTNSTNISDARLPTGPYPDNEELLYLCIRHVPTDLTTQTYSLNVEENWDIIVHSVVPIIPIRGRKKRKKKKPNRKDFEKDSEFILARLLQEKELKNVKSFIEKLKTKYKLKDDDILDLLIEKPKVTIDNIPVTIFDNDKLSALETIVKYLKENLKLSYHEIAVMLNRNDRTVWTTYQNSKKKLPTKFVVKETEILIPISIFKDRKFAPLELICNYLIENYKLTYQETSIMLNRNPRTVWTVVSRAKKKQTYA